MTTRILDAAPDGSELQRWTEAGTRLDRSNLVSWVSPDEQYALTVELDDPVHGYLIRLTHDDDRIAQAVVDDRDRARQVAAEQAAAAEDLAALQDRPSLGPETIHREDIDLDELSPAAPEDWADEEWESAVEEAFEKADVPRSKGTLTTKTIDGRDYYYLQWREGETVTSQYVGPVSPA